MNNKISISVIILCTIIGLYFLNLNSQKNYQSTSSSLINFEKSDINKFIIQSEYEVLEIVKSDTIWKISGQDTLQIKQQQLKRFFDVIFSLEKQNIMTNKKEKWSKYNIDDSTGTHLAIIDANGDTIEYYIFGRSKSDYARCYVRIGKEEEVFLLNNNMMYSLQAIPTYWGEVINNSENKDKLK